MIAKIIISLVAILCFFTFISSSTGLLLGVLIAVFFGNPFIQQTKKLTQYLLSISIIFMGAGMDLNVIGKVGLSGIGYTVISIALTYALGFVLFKIYDNDKMNSTLITTGTAICGGSAIAAVSPVLKADHKDISISLGVVFILNALALFIFPPIGHYFDLTQTQFGLWSALAIHDTSSVVGATLQYGPEALQTGTTIKLTRAIWIIPISLLFSFLVSRQSTQEKQAKIKFPWFILGFILAAAIVTWIPEARPVGLVLNKLSKQLLVVTLFLIGLNLTKENIKSVGMKSLLFGVTLWLLVSLGTFLAIYNHLIG